MIFLGRVEEVLLLQPEACRAFLGGQSMTWTLLQLLLARPDQISEPYLQVREKPRVFSGDIDAVRPVPDSRAIGARALWQLDLGGEARRLRYLVLYFLFASQVVLGGGCWPGVVQVVNPPRFNQL
jgi:hypothetical protein